MTHHKNRVEHGKRTSPMHIQLFASAVPLVALGICAGGGASAVGAPEPPRIVNEAPINHVESLAFAEHDWPCVAELCLGEGVEQLSNVRWDRARIPRIVKDQGEHQEGVTLSDFPLKELGRLFEGDIAAAAPYLAKGSFDSNALGPLSRVTASCVSEKLYGTYTAADGQPTRVGIALLPREGTQQWTVVEITKEILGSVSPAQKDMVRKELRNKYRRWERDVAADTSPRQGKAQATVTIYAVGNVMFTLELQLADAAPRQSPAACRAPTR